MSLAHRSAFSRLGCALWLGLAGLPAPASAQNQGLVVRDGSLGSGPLEVGSGIDPNDDFANYLIRADLGEQRGANLFHSFQRFGIGTDEVATFTDQGAPDPGAIDHVISRVTGAEASKIDGTLRSTIPGADVWLLNPNGVMFGAGAELDVDGSFHASTADHLGFGTDGLERFYSDLSRESVLSTATPLAFGFLSEKGAALLAVDRSSLVVPDGETLELVGGDVSLTLNAALTAPSGDVRLDAQGEVRISQSLVDVNRSGDEPGTIAIRGGKIVVERSSLLRAENASSVPAQPGGAIHLAGSESVLVDASLLSVSTHGAGNAGTIEVASPEITLNQGLGFDPLASPQESRVGLRAETTSSGKGGEIRMQAGDLVTLTNGIGVSASAVGSEVSGGAGTVEIAARTVELKRNSYVSAETAGAGEGGTISIEADESMLVDDSVLSVNTWSAGKAGTIRLGSKDRPIPHVTFQNGPGLPGFPNAPANATAVGARADTHARGAGGTIEIDASALTLADGVAVRADSIGADASGRAGTIAIRADSVDVLRDSFMGAAAYGSRGDAGIIQIATDTLRVDGAGGFAFLYVSALPVGSGTGEPGTIEITGHDGRARSVKLVNGGEISSQSGLRTSKARSRGRIRIATDSLRLEGLNAFGSGSTLNAGTSGAGDAGKIFVDARSVELDSGGEITARTSGTGKAGIIRLGSNGRPVGEIVIGAGGIVDAGTQNQGDGGSVFVNAGTLRIGPGEPALINVSSIRQFGASPDLVMGDAGTIDVVATDSIVLEKGGEGHTLAESLNVENGLFTGIFSATVRGGNSGSITVKAPEIKVADGASIATSTLGGGNAGTILLSADRIRVETGGSVDSTSMPWSVGPQDPFTPSLDAGSVTLDATESIEVAGGHPEFGVSRVSSLSLGSGAAGAVTLNAPMINIDGGAVLTTALPSREGFEGTQGGPITLSAFTPDGTRGELLVTNGGRVDASTLIGDPGGRGQGGSIDIGAGDSIIVAGMESGIASRTGGRGNSGAVTLRAPLIEVNDGGEISARSTSTPGLGELGDFFTRAYLEGLVGDVADGDRGTGGAGVIRLVDARRIHLIGGRITTSATDTNGGSIDLQATKLVHLDAGVIEASVIGGTGGNITIDPEVVLLENGSRIGATAGPGRGGRIQITADNYFAFPDSSVSASAGDPDFSGIVEVHTPDVDLAGNLTELPNSYLDAASLMRERCAARRSGEASGSFAVRGPSGIPAEPDGWLRASVEADADATAEAAPALPLLAASFSAPLLASGTCE